jgi:hypothetical protein
LDSPVFAATGEEAPADPSPGDTAEPRRRLLQTGPTASACGPNANPAACVPAAGNDTILLWKLNTAQPLTVNQPFTIELSPTTLRSEQLPTAGVELKFYMPAVGQQKPVTNVVNNGTANNTLSQLSKSGNNDLFTYTLPRSYVRAPGTTTVRVSVSCCCFVRPCGGY